MKLIFIAFFAALCTANKLRLAEIDQQIKDVDSRLEAIQNMKHFATRVHRDELTTQEIETTVKLVD